MQPSNRWMVVVLIGAALPLAACQQAAPARAKPVQPATVERVAGTNLNRVTLTERAAERLDIRTALVREAEVEPRGGVEGAVRGALRKVIPYAAVIYDPRGATWTYTSPAPLTFVRHQISVEYIEGDLAVLADGPAPGTAVVTVGAAELFGLDFGLGK